MVSIGWCVRYWWRLTGRLWRWVKRLWKTLAITASLQATRSAMLKHLVTSTSLSHRHGNRPVLLLRQSVKVAHRDSRLSFMIWQSMSASLVQWESRSLEIHFQRYSSILTGRFAYRAACLCIVYSVVQKQYITPLSVNFGMGRSHVTNFKFIRAEMWD